MDSFYITTPIYYVNDKPHIGHLYTTVIADAIARTSRLRGQRTFFLSGTDEHGKKIEKQAALLGISPQEMVDTFSPHFDQLFREADCSYDDFIRTTEKRHKDYVAAVWSKLAAAGHIYLGKYSGWYATTDECFYSADELVDGRAPTGAAVEWMEEECYFFRLASFREKLLHFYAANPDFITPPGRYKEVISFVQRDLRDLCISRSSCRWGIPVPGDDTQTQVIYVWLDALCNYLSAIQTSDRQDLWPCNLHVIGKDILIFHAVYWPAFLMALQLPLPQHILAHGWWTNDGQKISKSLGNVIDPRAVLERISSDQFRYFMLREVPLGSDGNYSAEALQHRLNGELANNLGNLIQRVTALVHKECAGQVQSVAPGAHHLQSSDEELLAEAYQLCSKVGHCVDSYELHRALEEILRLGSLANGYMDRAAPWALKNTDRSRMTEALSVLIEVIRVIAIALQPFVPAAAASILGIFVSDSVNPQGEASAVEFAQATPAGAPTTNYKIGTISALFPRYES